MSVPGGAVIGRTIRRVHMYLGLFLVPWTVLFALSNVAMNHKLHLGNAFGPVEERPYARTFEADRTPDQVAAAILADLDLAGPHWIDRRRTDARQLTFVMDSPLRGARVTYFRDAQRVHVERRARQVGTFLVSLHRGGVDSPFAAHWLWGISVDVLAVSLLVWVLSGLYMWWQIAPTRAWGAAAMAVGVGVLGVTIALM
jgi:hypothetical protein